MFEETTIVGLDMETKEECSVCGKTKTVKVRTQDGKSICNNCRRNQTKEECSICGKVKVVNNRTQNGKPVCQNCRRNQTKEECSICGKVKVVNNRTQNGKPVCQNCRNNQTKEECSICGKVKVVKVRTQDGKSICSNCRNNQTKEECSICGKVKVVKVRTQDGKPMCDSCNYWERPELLFKRYKQGAIRRNLLFTITKEEFMDIIKLPCYYCGRDNIKIGVDRYKNKIGYELENCRPCCRICNFMKGALDGDDFINQIRLIYNNKEKINEQKHKNNKGNC